MKTLPVLQIDADQVGPMGLTLGKAANNGGATDPKSVVIPIVEVTWADERPTCDLVHDFVFYEAPPDLAGCHAYDEGRCRRMGKKTPCAFLDDDPTVWEKARRWKRIPITPEPPYFHAWAFYYDPDDRHPDGDPLPEDEEVGP